MPENFKVPESHVCYEFRKVYQYKVSFFSIEIECDSFKLLFRMSK